VSEELVAGRRAAAEAVHAGRAEEVLVARGARDTQGMRALLEVCRASSVPVVEVDRARLDRLSPDHRGVVARLSSAPSSAASPLGERDLATYAFAEDAVVVILDGITDPQNLGAAARSAEAAGATMLVSRIHRAADVTPAAVRASAGALLHLPHARVANVGRAIQRLQDGGFFVVGLAGEAPDDVYAEPCPSGRVAIVVGSEGEGLARLTRERCDALVRLPMHGRVGSLNASASLAATLYAYVLPSRRLADPELQ
jgi:23S rRNA (guanosine2251-2'-O)-methyltransferase